TMSSSTPTPEQDWQPPARRWWRSIRTERRRQSRLTSVRCSAARLLVRSALGAALGVSMSCASAPRAGPLTGVPIAAGVPDTRLAPGYRRLIFGWEYKERVFSGKGEGVARIAPPDSVRI